MKACEYDWICAAAGEGALVKSVNARCAASIYQERSK